MQDGAPPPTAHRVLTWISDHFGERVVGQMTQHEWASHSPDLNPLDFFLWGHIKDQIMGQTFQNIDELKNIVNRLVKAIPQLLCERSIRNFVYRIRMCVRRNGRHVEHMLKHKFLQVWQNST